MARAGAIATLAGVVLGCAHVPGVSGKPTFTLKLTATSTLNSCGKSVAYPLRYKVLQVTDANPLAGMKLERLWDHESEMLGGALVWHAPESIIEPGKLKQERPVALDPRAKAVVVLANFIPCPKAKESCFYYVQPIAQKKVVLELTADATCLGPTRR